jgi:hypothetical protein
MKRKIINKKDNMNKRKINWNTMISPSNIKNYMMNDMLIDWVQYYKKYKITIPPYLQARFNDGKLFENIVINKLRKKYQVITINDTTNCTSYEMYRDTIKMMKKGVEIIYQGILHDYNDNTYGSPDLLVRSDRMEEIFNIIPHNINAPYYYIVVDIKHSLLDMMQDGIHLKNSNHIPAYKGQVLMYCRMLENIMGYKVNCGYILGKKWTYTKNNTSYSGNDMKLATIDYNTVDSKYKDKVDRAIEWIRRMRREGSEWLLSPPSCSELYPNMKNMDNIVIKREINKNVYDITSIWNCGIKERKLAHDNNIYRWDDIRLNGNIMGLKGNMCSIVDKILSVQRNEMIYINDLMKSKEVWREFNNNVMELYIDFETIIDKNDIGRIFMIGIGWEENYKWHFKNFIMKENTDMSELEMITEFNKYIKDHFVCDPIFIHWTHAEKSFYNNFLKKHDNLKKGGLNFFDLYKLFYNNKITVKGALNFSLKSIAKAMYCNKMIQSNWDSDNVCSDGLTAMHLALTLYENGDDIMTPIMDSIANYNMIDCKVMWEILKYLRSL